MDHLYNVCTRFIQTLSSCFITYDLQIQLIGLKQCVDKGRNDAPVPSEILVNLDYYSWMSWKDATREIGRMFPPNQPVSLDQFKTRAKLLYIQSTFEFLRQYPLMPVDELANQVMQFELPSETSVRLLQQQRDEQLAKEKEEQKRIQIYQQEQEGKRQMDQQQKQENNKSSDRLTVRIKKHHRPTPYSSTIRIQRSTWQILPQVGRVKCT